MLSMILRRSIACFAARLLSPGPGRAAGLGDWPCRRRRPAAKDFPPGHYVDVHTHLGQTWNTHAAALGRRAAEVDGRQRDCAGRRAAAGFARVVELSADDRFRAGRDRSRIAIG